MIFLYNFLNSFRVVISYIKSASNICNPFVPDVKHSNILLIIKLKNKQVFESQC